MWRIEIWFGQWAVLAILAHVKADGQLVAYSGAEARSTLARYQARYSWPLRLIREP